ncbi:sulfotransferase [Sulfurimonas sp. HSL1-6]|uniref:sulfotransferase n=1 Tax=Thiomicrolovo immobilis TaxID=3131935 RepID=UPI0031F8DEC4
MKQIGQPVIIIGMHRSGTTMLTGFLSSYNIFMGNVVEQNGEAVSFLRLNEQLLHKCQSSWNDDKDITQCISKRKNEFVKLFKDTMNTSSFEKNFFGDHALDLDKNFSWGWKDPRNTLTLDVIKEVFPKAKFIHIHRNPVDVAASLRSRERRFSLNGKLKWYYNVMKNLIKRGVYIRRAPELEELSAGFKLWKKYVSQAMDFDGEIIHLSYESFLVEPQKNFEKICHFLGIEYQKKKIEEICQFINQDRKFSFVSDDELIEFYKKIQTDPMLQALGYENILK